MNSGPIRPLTAWSIPLSRPALVKGEGRYWETTMRELCKGSASAHANQTTAATASISGLTYRFLLCWSHAFRAADSLARSFVPGPSSEDRYSVHAPDALV